MAANVSLSGETAEHLSELHPALARLHAAVTDFTEAERFCNQALSTVNRTCSFIDPKDWVNTIEKARNEPERLKDLGLRYNECSIGYVSDFLNWHALSYQANRKFDSLEAAIVDAIMAHQGMEITKENEWLTVFFKASIANSAAVKWREVQNRLDLERNDTLYHRSKELQFAAFNSLEEIRCNWGAYFSAPVVPPGAAPGINPAELRNCYAVPLTFAAGSDVEASRTLFSDLEEARRIAKKCVEIHRLLANGESDENAYANSLVLMVQRLHFAAEPLLEVAGVSSAVESRLAPRCEFGLKQKLLSQFVSRLERQLMKVAESLKAAVLETAKRLPGRTGLRYEADFLLTIMVNNCLSADRDLRLWMRQIAEFRDAAQADSNARAISGDALSAAYGYVCALYNSRVQLRRQSLHVVTGK